MHLVVGAVGLALLVAAVSDAFQTVLVARHVHKLPIITGLFYQLTWLPFAEIAGLIRSEQRRAWYLGLYGPLSLLLLLALWAISLILSLSRCSNGPSVLEALMRQQVVGTLAHLATRRPSAPAAVRVMPPYAF
jgi:hypothetical protein